VVVILLIAAYLTPYFDLPVVQKAFAGIRAAVVAMIAMAVYQVGRRAADSPAKRAIAAGALIAVAGLQVHPVLMIVGAGLLGWMLFRKEPGQE
jgi:chromate transporter